MNRLMTALLVLAAFILGGVGRPYVHAPAEAAPASRAVEINVLNPDTSAALLQANVVLTGQFLDTGAHVGV